MNRHPFKELLPHLEQTIENGLISEEERADLLYVCQNIKTQDGYYKDETADIQRLQGILAGIVADQIITKDELEGLRTWAKDHHHLSRTWPYEEVISLVSSVLEDGKIDDAEHQDLLAYFSQFIGEKKGKKLETARGICALCPEIQFQDRGFCVTGESSRATRAEIKTLIQSKGGTFHRSMSGNVDYLVVGSEGNPVWAFSCYGRKIEQAINLREQGGKIMLIHEFDFWDAVDDSKE